MKSILHAHYMLILIMIYRHCTFNFHAASSTWVSICPCEHNYSLMLNTVLYTFIIICTGSQRSWEFLPTQFWFPGRLPANKLWLFCGHGTQSCQQQLPWYPPWGWCTGMGGCWVLRGQKNGKPLTILKHICKSMTLWFPAKVGGGWRSIR